MMVRTFTKFQELKLLGLGPFFQYFLCLRFQVVDGDNQLEGLDGGTKFDESRDVF